MIMTDRMLLNIEPEVIAPVHFVLRDLSGRRLTLPGFRYGISCSGSDRLNPPRDVKRQNQRAFGRIAASFAGNEHKELRIRSLSRSFAELNLPRDFQCQVEPALGRFAIGPEKTPCAFRLHRLTV
jgi:hypothetical protein